MNSNSNLPQEWKPCDMGYLVAFSQRAKSVRRRRVAVRTMGGVSVMLMAVSLGLWSTGLWSGLQENYFGGIACYEVAENLPALMAGTVSNELRAKIEEHLRYCPRCQNVLEMMQARQTDVGDSGEHLACDCPQCQHRVAQAVLDALGSAAPQNAVAWSASPRFADSYSEQN